MQDALRAYERSLAISQRLGDKTRKTHSLWQIALLHVEGDQDKALEYFLKCLELFEDLKAVHKVLLASKHVFSLCYKMKNFYRNLFISRRCLMLLNKLWERCKNYGNALINLRTPEKKKEWDNSNFLFCSA